MSEGAKVWVDADEYIVNREDLESILQWTFCRDGSPEADEKALRAIKGIVQNILKPPKPKRRKKA